MPPAPTIAYKRPPVIDTGNVKMNLLVVSPSDTDHTTLRQILSPKKWVVSAATTLRSAQQQLRTAMERIPLVLCECDLSPGTWRELVDQLARMEDAPLLIVSSRHADERLWAEALNVGAFDVLAKPFEAGEVSRVLTSAWVRWTRDHPHLDLGEVAAVGA
jgi:DNA-binding NtrC family response regulator